MNVASLYVVSSVLAVAVAGIPAAAQDGSESRAADAAVLGALDKITARVSEIVIPVGGQGEFFRLSIEVRSCQERIVEQRPESGAFLVITETPLEGEPVRRFSGWMFASSPSVSAMDHPIYDVWVVRCADAPEQAEEGEETDATEGG